MFWQFLRYLYWNFRQIIGNLLFRNTIKLQKIWMVINNLHIIFFFENINEIFIYYNIMFLFGKFLCHTINWSSANIPFSFMILRKSSRQILVHRFSIRRSTLKTDIVELPVLLGAILRKFETKIYRYIM